MSVFDINVWVYEKVVLKEILAMKQWFCREKLLHLFLRIERKDSVKRHTTELWTECVGQIRQLSGE